MVLGRTPGKTRLNCKTFDSEAVPNITYVAVWYSHHDCDAQPDFPFPAPAKCPSQAGHQTYTNNQQSYGTCYKTFLCAA